jgi:hypothetical protein
MNFSSSTVATEFPKQMAQLVIDRFAKIPEQSARMVWNFVMPILAEHWLLIMGIFVGLLIFLVLLAIMGDWGGLYSLTYWTLYAFTIFIVGLIWGPESLVSDIFHIIYIAAIWPVCYLVTGWIWDRFNFRRRKW